MIMTNLTPIDIESRRSRAAKALAKAVVERADVNALTWFLAATPAESANDRLDDLCGVWVRSPLSDRDVNLIEGKSEASITKFVEVYGSSYTAQRVWLHSWTRRKVRRQGEWVVRPRADWLAENALFILRAGGVEVKTFDGPWVRVASEAEYVSIAMRAANEES